MPATQPPALLPLTRIECDVGPLVSLGGLAKHGERRYVVLGAGQARGPELNGSLVEGGIDWQVQRADSATEISAHSAVQSFS